MLALLSLIVVTACASPSSQLASAPAGDSASNASARTTTSAGPKTLRLVTRLETPDLAPKSAESGGGNEIAKRLFNAQLALLDAQVVAHPYLAESLPQLNTDTWKVFPDGRMETTYTLRPNLTWQDGQPLTADDFVFAYKVYTTPGMRFSVTPLDQIDSVTAPDPLTLVIQWKRPYAEAGQIVYGDLDPLPAHLLSGPFQSVGAEAGSAEAFSHLPFWTEGYVGAGPYRLTRWERGAYLEGEAFAGHALGKPKIDRIQVYFQGDENVVLTRMLAGDLDLAPRLTLRFEHAQTLKKDWEPSGKGKVLLSPDSLIYNMVQFRPEYQQEPALLDPRVRKALAHTVDRQAVIDGLFDGLGDPLNTFVPRNMPYFDEVERTIAKYPYDVRRSEQLMTEAGFARDRDGYYQSADGRRFQPDFQVRATEQFVRGQTIMVDFWRRAGFFVQPSQLPEIQVDISERHTFPAMAGQSAGGSETERLLRFAGSEIGLASNRWRGSNWAGWSNAEYDRLWDTFKQTLDRNERTRLAVQMMKVLNDDLPAYVVYANFAVMAHVASIKGPEVESRETTAPMWNVHEWEMT
jgi:peptide/nickel transport system substrate-binding protein